MEVRIRLETKGAKSKNRYQIIVVNSKKNSIIEVIGQLYYENEKKWIIINKDRLAYWVSNGGKLSKRMKKELIGYGNK